MSVQKIGKMSVYSAPSFSTIDSAACAHWTAASHLQEHPISIQLARTDSSADRASIVFFGGTMLLIDDDIDLRPPAPIFRAKQLDLLVDMWLAAARKRLGKPRQTPDKPPQLHSVTVDGYEDDLAHFRRWWAEVGPMQNWEMREEDLHDFNRWLTNSTALSFNSRKDVLRRLKSMLHWAFTQRHIKTLDFSLWVPEAEGSAPVRVLPGLSVLAKVMRAADRSTNPVRDKAILAVFIDTGMRRSECANLEIKDVLFRPDGGGIIIVRRAKTVKGREIQQRPVIFAKTAGHYICHWINALADEGHTCGPLFPSPVIPGKPIDPNVL
ncbi:MAG: tyrosine-type recombinase/integrase, partial [Caldilineaceae bacterium]|nr:tyrosine-type recombinase/integrase [Caldilineaceae bacterium]